MDAATWYELLGYLASALIVISLLMSSILRLRIIGLVGAVAFTAYGLLIEAFPIALANGAIILIHVFHLSRMLRDRASDSYFEVLEVPADSPVLRRFLAFHDADLRRFQPDFEPVTDDDTRRVLLVLRDAVPAGVVVAEIVGDVARVDLDYVTAAHRDLHAGSWLWGDSSVFAKLGAERIVAFGRTPEHARYLAAVGFSPAGDDRWERAS
ncbi:YgjV family protein [Nitriliruptoraceae bacterium ZYF776]|nr:YgjV family protein [Profundirhabdus halotolerans]